MSKISRTGVIISVLSIILYKYLSYTKAPVLTIETGKIEGIILSSRIGREYAAYLGIPFATPPVGELRFKPPEPAKPWNGVRDASSFGAVCAQFEMLSKRYRGEEDCLFVNVFTPKVVSNADQDFSNQTTLLPVLVNFHGGYFQLGSPDNLGEQYIMDEDIVFVTPAYRLGVFGFLSTGDDVVQGNMGLKDQLLALKWVQKNIRTFGGDPERVTISGTSAGGASVHHHILSRQSKGLFRRAISASGTALAEWAVNPKPREQAQYFADRLNCSSENSAELLGCLQSKTAQEIGNANAQWADPSRTRIDIFVPVIECQNGTDQFLTQPAAEILKSGNYNRVPWMSGVMAAEATFFAMPMQTNETFRNLIETQWDSVAAKIINAEDDPEFVFRLKSEYFPVDHGSSNRLDLRKDFINYTHLISDSFFNYPLQSSAQLQLKFSPVYLYYNNYTADYSLVTLISNIKGKHNFFIEMAFGMLSHFIHRKLLGVYPPFHATSHGDDLILEFPIPIPGLWIGKGHPDYQMSRDLVKSYVDFATITDLNDLTFRNVKWSPIKSGDTQLALRISNDPAMIIPAYTKRLKFWSHYKNADD